jgi:hypothetical protein
MFPGRRHYASVFPEAEFRSLPKLLDIGSELRNLLEAAIEDEAACAALIRARDRLEQ